MRRLALVPTFLLVVLVTAQPAHAACATTRVQSLAALQAMVAAGHSACLADGSYAGNVDLSTRVDTAVTVSQEGNAVIHGQVRLGSSHLGLDGITADNTSGTGSRSDCLRVTAVGATDIRIVDSNIGPCARDAIRMIANQGQHDTGVTIQGDVLHDAALNACTCYMRGGVFADNVVERVHNDALNLWGDSNTVTRNVFRDLVPDPGNHNDVLQTWRTPGDPAVGDPLTNLTFTRNVIDTVSGPDSHGLVIRGEGNGGLTIESNLFRDVGSFGALIDGATDVDFVANTFARAGAMDAIEWKDGATGSMDSNVFYGIGGSRPDPWYQDATSSPDHRYNLAWGGRLLSDEDTGINADPAFADPDGVLDDDRANDFQILDPSSPAIDHGDPAIAYRVDLLGAGIFNGRVDAGAFEYQGS